MTEQEIILNKLLDKFFNSKPLVENTERNRDVILKCDNKNFPEYNYEDYEIKEKYYKAIKELEAKDIVTVKERRGAMHIVEEIRLVIENSELACALVGRPYVPNEVDYLKSKLAIAHEQCELEWLKQFFSNELRKLENKCKLVGLWKKDRKHIDDVVNALVCLKSTIQVPISMRVFSQKLYHDSKHFERNVQDDVISIIKSYELETKEAVEADIELSARQILTHVGIIPRSEIFEFCGDIEIFTTHGKCDFSSLKHGVSIRDENVSEIVEIRYSDNIKRILFIENKTNYDEYILKYKKDEELVVFHGGFSSPRKREFFKLIETTKSNTVSCYFWADIDYGGFSMFRHLKQIFLELQPLHMDVEIYKKYLDYGICHKDRYFDELEKLLQDETYSAFYPVIKAIVENKKTVEQEIMLEF